MLPCLLNRFHTSFLDPDAANPSHQKLHLTRDEVDNPHKERTWDIFTDKFSIQLTAQKIR